MIQPSLKLSTTPEVELQWKERIVELWNASLFPMAESWYQGVNIPGKPRESLNFIGGLPAYTEALSAAAENEYSDFTFT